MSRPGRARTGCKKSASDMTPRDGGATHTRRKRKGGKRGIAGMGINPNQAGSNKTFMGFDWMIGVCCEVPSTDVSNDADR